MNKGKCYYLLDFRWDSLHRGKKEIFNHSIHILSAQLKKKHLPFEIINKECYKKCIVFLLKNKLRFVIASMTLHNFKRINVKTYIEFIPYDDQ